MDLFLAKVGISAVMLPIAVVSYVIGFVASWFVTLGGTLTNWALDINSNVLTSITVKTGWIVSRDLANLGFVLAIILIAFITILRYESYDTKKMLVRLISAALLINFSLVIAGVFIDFSGLMTNFFLSKATSGNLEQIGPGLVGSLRAHELFQQKADEATIKNQVEGMGGDFNKFIVFLATQTFISVFTIITAISLFSIAIMLYVRYIALTILLILMPIAWLMWIWPDLAGYWSSWWKTFMKWCFFAPSMSFFIYLAFQVALTFKQTEGAWVGQPVAGVGDMGILIQNFSSILGQMVSVLGILYGGLYTANAMGIAGADIGISAVGKVKGYITGAPGATGAYIGRKYGMGGLDNVSARMTGKTVNENLRGFTAGLSGVPLVGETFQNINKQLKSSGEANISEWIKHYDALDPEARKKAYEGRIISPDERAGLMASMANKGQMKDLKFEADGKTVRASFDRYAQMAVGRGGDISKALITKDPELAKYKLDRTKFPDKVAFDRAQRAEIGKAVAGMSIDAINDLRTELLTQNPEYLAQARNSLILKFGEQRSHEDKVALYESIANKIRNIRNSAVRTSEDESMEKNLSAKLHSMAKSPAWSGYISDMDLVKKPKETKEPEEE